MPVTWTPNRRDIPPPPGWKGADPSPIPTGHEKREFREAWPKGKLPKEATTAETMAEERPSETWPQWATRAPLRAIGLPENVAAFAGDVWPYGLLSFIPGGPLTAIPLRAAGAAAIGAATANPGERLSGATYSTLAQEVAEAIGGPGAAVGVRLTARAFNRYADEIAETLMDNAKSIVGWWRKLPDGHRGIEALLTDQGMATLGERYGAALRAKLADALKGEKIPLLVADAQALKIPARSAVFPSGTVLVDADEAAVAAQMKFWSPVAGRVTASVKELTDVLAATKPQAADRIRAVLEGTALEKEKRAYSEGINLIYALRKMSVLDPVTKRVDPENLIKGVAIRFGRNPQTVYDAWLTQTKAPQSRELIQGIAAGKVAPSRVAVPRIRSYARHGALTENFPLTLYSKNVPYTEAEEAIKRYAPGAVGALTQMGAEPYRGR